MLDLRFFKNPQFSSAAAAIVLVFFALFGTFFLLTQYLQLVRGYSALQAGIHTLPAPLTIMLMAPMSAKLVERLGTRMVVASGLSVVALGLALPSALGTDTPYLLLAVSLVILAGGMAMSMAPATTAIMTSLPLGKAGVGSAVNDTTRELGGALGWPSWAAWWPPTTLPPSPRCRGSPGRPVRPPGLAARRRSAPPWRWRRRPATGVPHWPPPPAPPSSTPWAWPSWSRPAWPWPRPSWSPGSCPPGSAPGGWPSGPGRRRSRGLGPGGPGSPDGGRSHGADRRPDGAGGRGLDRPDGGGAGGRGLDRPDGDGAGGPGQRPAAGAVGVAAPSTPTHS